MGIFIVIAYLFGREEEREERKGGNVDRGLLLVFICEQRLPDARTDYRGLEKIYSVDRLLEE